MSQDSHKHAVNVIRLGFEAFFYLASPLFVIVAGGGSLFWIAATEQGRLFFWLAFAWIVMGGGTFILYFAQFVLAPIRVSRVDGDNAVVVESSWPLARLSGLVSPKRISETMLALGRYPVFTRVGKIDAFVGDEEGVKALVRASAATSGEAIVLLAPFLAWLIPTLSLMFYLVISP